jgi:hypothetical protein
MRSRIFLVFALLLFSLIQEAASAEPKIIALTQTACQMLEPEGIDRHFVSTRPDDCKAINRKTAEQRLASAKTLRLKPGSYIFRVTNKNVPYQLGFYLRGDGIVNSVRLPKVSGGGLAKGVTKNYRITLVKGEYVYSCPLNPTPDYKLVVAE